MTEKIYYKDAYIKTFDATVLKCEKENDTYKVILDKTAFFPEGGGQGSDVGRIGDAKVFNVLETIDGIIHYCDKEVMGKVSCEIDFKKRFDKMQNHTGEHIVSGIVSSLYNAKNVGFHLNNEIVTMDYDIMLTPYMVSVIEEKANEAVYNNLPINCYFPSEDELEKLEFRSKSEIKDEIRIVDIKGLDLCACCAPHTKNTGEVGIIKIVDVMSHRGGARVTLLCGERAFKHYKENFENVRKISKLLSSKQSEISNACERLIDENADLKHKIGKCELSLAKTIADGIQNTDKSIVLKADMSPDSIRELVNLCVEKTTKFVCVMNENRYVIGSKTINLRELAKDLNSALDGKGGGTERMIQGTFNAPFEIIKQKLGMR